MRLWKRRFDLAILPRWDIDYYHGSFLAYFSGARQRLSYSEYVKTNKHKRNNAYDKLFTHVIMDSLLKHEAERNLEVIKFLGGQVKNVNLELWPDKNDDNFVRSLFEHNNLSRDSFIIGIGLGAREAKRAWPVGRYLGLIAEISKNKNIKIITMGDRDEINLGEYIEEHIDECIRDRVTNIIGKTTLRQLACVLRYCKLYIGNDTGIMHIAAAMSVPVLEISSWPESGNRFSDKSPYRFGPWKVNHIVVNPDNPIPPCKDECRASKPHCIYR